MQDSTSAMGKAVRALEDYADLNEKMMTALLEQAKAAQTYWVGLCRSVSDFMAPSFVALASLAEVEKCSHDGLPPQDVTREYQSFWQSLIQMSENGLINGLKSMSDFHLRQMDEAFKTWMNTLFRLEGEDLPAFMARQAKIMDLLVHSYPRAIKEIESEYGFHFEDDGRYVKVAETDRFYLYQVLPWHADVKVRQTGKPVVLLHAYVLGPNIMAFWPGNDKSFAHCFANQGVPTYIRIVKDIDATPAVQTMTGEDDCRDLRLFCELVNERHGKKATLCGYCQGGYIAVCNLLSGELDDSVDALITCVAPMDGTRSKGLSSYLCQLSPRFRDWRVAIKTLDNGNQVVDGSLTSWTFRLKNLENENPITAFYQNLQMMEKGQKIGKTAAALNYWMRYDITDLPVAITEMSFASYTVPVTADGTLPVKLFGRDLNFNRIKEKGIPWLICCADRDDLVEKDCALAPLDWVQAEVSLFPKGHVAMATSWTVPTSECALTACFGDKCRGPVRYQLDLEAALESRTPAAAAPPAKSARRGRPASPKPKPLATVSRTRKPKVASGGKP